MRLTESPERPKFLYFMLVTYTTPGREVKQNGTYARSSEIEFPPSITIV